METGLTLFGALEALFFVGGITAAMVLPGWLQKRQRERVRLQIALTDALDAVFGPIVAPMVNGTLWGPWQVEIAVPLDRLAVLGRILGVANAALVAAGRFHPSHYRIALRPGARVIHAMPEGSARGGAGKWVGDPLTAAR